MNENADLDALRSFRAADAIPPPGLQERLEESMWQVVLEEEARLRGGARLAGGTRSRATRWLDQLLRPATAIGVAVSIAAVLAIASGSQDLGGSAASIDAPASQAAGVFDATAASLFGGSAAVASSNDAGFPAGSVPIKQLPDSDTGTDSTTVASQLPRDPRELLAVLEQSAAEATSEIGGDSSDRMAFLLAMTWVTDTSVPADLRASFVRAMGGLDGIDAVSSGSDLFGRQGMILGHLDELTGVRDQYVLTANGGQLLERRSFTTSYVDAACPPGTFTGYAAYEDGAAITPENAPWAAWPVVIEACDPALAASGSR